MPRLLPHIVAAFLVPCLLADPLFCAVFPNDLNLGHAISRTKDSEPFTEQALSLASGVFGHIGPNAGPTIQLNKRAIAFHAMDSSPAAESTARRAGVRLETENADEQWRTLCREQGLNEGEISSLERYTDNFLRQHEGEMLQNRNELLLSLADPGILSIQLRPISQEPNQTRAEWLRAAVHPLLKFQRSFLNDLDADIVQKLFAGKLLANKRERN